MTAIRFIRRKRTFGTSFLSLGLLLTSLQAGLYGCPAMAEPADLGTAQLIERGYWGVTGCFGTTLDVENGVAVVGDPCDAMTAGAAYAFAIQTGGLWEETWRHAKGRGYEDDLFGAAVSINASRVVIGEPAITGSMHFYDVLSDGALRYVSTYRYPVDWNEIPGDGFGAKLVLDGQTVVSGSRFYRRVYVMEEENGDWREVEQVAALNIFDVDGDSILIGNPQDDFAGEDTGAVRVLARNRHGNWLEREAFRPDDPVPGQRFGQSVAISGDRAIIGATGRQTDSGAVGVAYVFERDTGGAWWQVARLDQAGAPHCPSAGRTVVALAGDVGVVACPVDSRPAAVFSRQPDGNWTQIARLVGQGVMADSGFGTAIALDLPWVVIGASNQAHAADDEVRGAVHFFDLSPLGTVQQAAIDVLPWREANVIDPGSRSLVAVAVFSSAAFDALQTDLTTIRLNPGDARARNYRVMDVDRNGIPDLLFWVRSRDLDIGCGETKVDLSAQTHAGLAIDGGDEVTHRWCQEP